MFKRNERTDVKKVQMYVSLVFIGKNQVYKSQGIKTLDLGGS